MIKLGLGTVQFGCNYGISNSNGQVKPDEVGRILDFAGTHGITYIDTASIYGTSEEILGQFYLDNFRVITKTTRVNKNYSRSENINSFKKALAESKRKLSLNRIYGLLFHESDDLLGDLGCELWELVEDFKRKEGVSKIGVSVYNPEQLIQVLAKYNIDIVQLPLNIFDQRFVPLLAELKKKNIEIHSRSAFLQGLLLMDTDNVNDYFIKVKPLLDSIPDPKIAYALDFVKKQHEVDRIIVGCTNLKEIDEIMKMYCREVEEFDYSRFKVDDSRIINPSLWEIK